MFAKLTICVLTRERPVNGSVQGIAVLFPSGNLMRQSGLIEQSQIQPLATQCGDFDFCHVEPTGMLWRVVKLDAPEKFGCALYSQDIVNGLAKAGVEIIQDKMNPACRKAPSGRISDGDWPVGDRAIVQRQFQPAIRVCRARAPDHHASIAKIDHSEDSSYRISRLTANKLLETPAPGALRLRSNRSLNSSK